VAAVKELDAKIGSAEARGADYTDFERALVWHVWIVVRYARFLPRYTSADHLKGLGSQDYEVVRLKYILCLIVRVCTGHALLKSTLNSLVMPSVAPRLDCSCVPLILA
jgi:hypothetical protein